MKRSTKRLLALFIATLISLPIWYTYFAAPVRASVSETYVYVCNDPGGNWPCGIDRFGPVSYESSYVAHILANEWPGEASDQSLKAGAIAIRTFGWRSIPCGAVDNYYTIGDTQYRVENNYSQSYWLPDGSQNPILTKHTNAVDSTAEVTLRNHTTYDYVCAKYKADCGNPTADGDDEAWTLVGVPDPVDSDNGGYYLEGLSQNGTHAWELDGYAGAAPWDYRQILTHYYAQVTMIGLSFDRWTWLDVDTAGGIRYTGYSGEQYYGPLAHTPQTMQTGRAYDVPFHIQNTGAYQWNDTGSYPERLSYHWYDSEGDLVTRDGLRTSLGTDIVYQSRDIHLQARIVAPFHPGSYILAWDMVSEEGTDIFWFSDSGNDWPTQDITVDVQPSATLVHLPYVRNSGGWVSTITIRNYSGSSAEVDVTYMAGSCTDSSFSYVLSSGETREVTPPADFFGSAWAAANRDITVSVYPEPEQVFLPLMLNSH